MNATTLPRVTPTPAGTRLAAIVRFARRRRGLSVAALARTCGVGYSVAYNVERYSSASPSRVVLARLAAALELDLAVLEKAARRNRRPRRMSKARSSRTAR